MTSIFLSYRRKDTQEVTREIYQELAKYYGGSFIFLDERTILLAEDFREKIRDELLQCSVFIPIIGSQWLQFIIKSGVTGGKWEEPEDYVWLEIEEALSFEGLYILPILIDGVPAPNWKDLPHKLRDIPFKNAYSLESNSVRMGIRSLVRDRLNTLVKGSSLTIMANPSHQDDYEALRREHYRHEAQFCLEMNNGEVDAAGTIYLNALRQHLHLPSHVITRIQNVGTQAYSQYSEIISKMIQCTTQDLTEIDLESLHRLQDVIGRTPMIYLKRLHLNFKIPRHNAIKIEQRIFDEWKQSITSQVNREA